MEVGEWLAGTTEEAGVFVVVGEVAAAVLASLGTEFQREIEGPVDKVADPRLVPPSPLRMLDPKSETELLAVKLVAGFDGGVSPAPESTPVVWASEGDV